MAVFDYKAIDQEGNVREGTIDAVNVDLAISALQRRGLVISSIDEAKKKGGGLSLRIDFFDRVTNEDVVMLSRQMTTLFEAQVSALRAFRLLAEEARTPKLAEGSPDRNRQRYPERLDHFLRARQAPGGLLEFLRQHGQSRRRKRQARRDVLVPRRLSRPQLRDHLENEERAHLPGVHFRHVHRRHDPHAHGHHPQHLRHARPGGPERSSLHVGHHRFQQFPHQVLAACS